MSKPSKTKNNAVHQEKFLSDKPITADREQEIRFGHRDLAESLLRIILSCPTSFTIGLFGKWGAGKTTILNMLEKRLNIASVAVANFDVWKHEADSLRGTFLKEIVKQLKDKKYLLKEFELSERLDAPITREFKGQFKIDAKKMGLLICVLLAMGIVALLIACFWPKLLGNFVTTITSGTLVAGFLLWMLQQTLTSEKTTTTIDRLRDPHEFEIEFKNIIKSISSEKLLVIIDNLDRTSHEKAVELLSTVKTFLEQEKCIFLIACDDEAIKKHLESVYIKDRGGNNQTPFDANEFLRKFFNASLQIPNFIDTELQTYSEDLLRQTAVPQFDSADVAYVIANAFRDNPRQIKQFINTMLAHFFLAQERENSTKPLIIPKGTITGNVAFLAKFLILRQQFSADYQKILESRATTLDEIEEEFTNSRLKLFLQATKQITVEDIRPFRYLKRSKEELEIPEIENLELALIDNNLGVVNERIGFLKEMPDQIQMLNTFVKGLIVRYKNRKIPLFNIVSSSLNALQSHSLQFDPYFYGQIADMLIDEKSLGTSLQSFEPSLIFKEVLKRCNNRDRNKIIDQYINILHDQEEGKGK